MPVVEDALWKNPGHPGMIVITTSASLDKHGRLVMRDQDEMEAARRIPGIERLCGKTIQESLQEEVYGFIPVKPSRPEINIVGFGIFQVRRHWNECADLELIRCSTQALCRYLEANRELKVRMKFPGACSKGLPPEQVLSLLQDLPPTVTICHSGEVALSQSQGLNGTKDLFMLVERWLQEGRFSTAVEFLTNNGYDSVTALEQVSSVQRLVRELEELEVKQQSKNRKS